MWCGLLQSLPYDSSLHFTSMVFAKIFIIFFISVISIIINMYDVVGKVCAFHGKCMEVRAHFSPSFFVWLPGIEFMSPSLCYQALDLLSPLTTWASILKEPFGSTVQWHIKDSFILRPLTKVRASAFLPLLYYLPHPRTAVSFSGHKPSYILRIITSAFPGLEDWPRVAHLVISRPFWNLTYFHSFPSELLPSWDP